MKYLTTTELAKKRKISSRMIAIYCTNKKIDGSYKIGNTWLIPFNAIRPIDGRTLKKNTYSVDTIIY